MRILLLVPNYMDLYKPIVEGLTSKGHIVHVIFDKTFQKEDYNYPWLGMHDRIWRRWKCFFYGTFRKYWEERLHSDLKLSDRYDVFLCVNGCSLCNYILNLIEKKNPKIRKILYLWDDSSFYGYYQYAKRFDRVLTYDLDDSIKYQAEFLPIYWSNEPSDKKIKYTISMVGTNHSNRLAIVSSIVSQLKNHKVEDYYFKVIDKSLLQSEFVSHHIFPQDEMTKIMSQSKCILDIDRPSQSGTTPRLIWALALGKKVITTNTNIERMPFYSPESILIIDRNNPIIDFNFINNPFKGEIHPYIKSLKIDLWLERILK